MIRVFEEVNMYLKRIPTSVELEGTHQLLKMIKSTDIINQQRDYLMSFILASLYSGIVKKIVFEEDCSKHPSEGPHDLVVYLDSGIRIVNEIRRLKQTKWDKNEQENYVLDAIKKTGRLYALREDPNRSTTGFLDTILKEIEGKSDQLDPNEINIIWIASKGIHYKATNIEDAASHYISGWHKISDDQPGKAHKMPKNLSALGWFWDGDPYDTTAKAKCFFIVPSEITNNLNNTFEVKKLYNT